MPLTGHRATIHRASSPLVGMITSIAGNALSRPALEAVHLDVDDVEKIPGDLVDAGALTVNFLFDPEDVPEWDEEPDEYTITFPLQAGQSTAAAYVFSGFMTRHKFDNLTTNEVMTGSVEITLDGADVDWVAAT